MRLKGHSFKDFKFVHLPHHHSWRYKVKRLHYRSLLATFALLVLAAHYYAPDHEPHVTALATLLAALDPT